MNKQTQEALKMAIEWMEKYHQMHIIEMGVGERWIDLSMAIQACKEALEQPAQEPVGYTTKFDLETALEGNTLLWFVNKNGKYNIPLYTHPAPSWQGLTDDEIEKVFESIETSTTHRKIYRAIEAKLKEKNL